MTRQSAPFVRVIKAHTVITDEEVRITLRAFWFILTPAMLSDIEGVTLEYQRTVPTSHGLVQEFRLTVKGDMARCITVQSVITQTMRGNTQAARALAQLANRQIQ
jgi:hypothetical protein